MTESQSARLFGDIIRLPVEGGHPARPLCGNPAYAGPGMGAEYVS